MRVLLISQFFPPETGAAARRLEAIADALAEHCQLTVLTLQPSYPRAEMFNQQQVVAIDSRKTYPILRPFHFHPYRPSMIRRGLAELWLAVRLAWRAIGVKQDAVMISTPSMFLAPVFMALSVIRQSIFIWDVRDLTWRYVKQTGEGRGLENLLSSWLERLMNWVMHQANLLIVTNSGAAEILTREYHLPPEKIRLMVNGVSRQFFDQFNEVTHKIHERPKVLYLGLVGNNHCLEVLVPIAEALPEVDFVVVGDGPRMPQLKQLIQDRCVGNISLEGYIVDEADIVRFYRSADVLFNHTCDTEVLNSGVIAAKIFEYMATGKPIISGSKGVTARLLESKQAAIIVPPEQPEAIAAELTRLIDLPELRMAVGSRAREAVEKSYVREDLAEELAGSIVRSVASQNWSGGES